MRQFMEHGECGCAIDLHGLVVEAKPSCTVHLPNQMCILHDGEWAMWKCLAEHDDTQRALYQEILRIRREAIRISVEAAVTMALYGSVFLQVDHVPGKVSRVTVRSPRSVTIRL